ncbi:Uncharacterised protein [Vibrio cholerae]|nr:Uncharacterised protein [Vibrio cholerae]
MFDDLLHFESWISEGHAFEPICPFSKHLGHWSIHTDHPNLDATTFNNGVTG